MLYLSALIVCITSFLSCKDKKTVDNVFKYFKPNYELVDLKPTADTLKFSLDENSFNDIQSFNLFTENTKQYISFHDQRSETITIYSLDKQRRIKKIELKGIFIGKKLYKTTAYIKSLDSIFITNNRSLYIVNKDGAVIKTVSFLKNPPFAWAYFKNTNPPIFVNNNLYIGVRPYVKNTSQKALKEWKVLYKFNLLGTGKYLYYNLPKNYQDHLYGYYFMEYNYCYNNHGRYVFSFPADTNIYETDLSKCHIAYFAKSQFQTELIKPVDKKDLSNVESEYKSFLARDSYGAIYFDPYKRRYLRVFKSKITEEDYQKKNKNKEQRLIVFDENLKIIGESKIDNSISLSTIFFTSDGKIYARVNLQDEYNLNFIRLVYNDDKLIESTQLTKNEIQYK
jgi:hypothetical protein